MLLQKFRKTIQKNKELLDLEEFQNRHYRDIKFEWLPHIIRWKFYEWFGAKQGRTIGGIKKRNFIIAAIIYNSRRILKIKIVIIRG